MGSQYENATTKQQAAARAVMARILNGGDLPEVDTGPYAGELKILEMLVSDTGPEHAKEQLPDLKALNELRQNGQAGTDAAEATEPNTSDGSQQPPEVPPMDWKRTDYGNAERLIHAHGRDLHYCYAWDEWLAWDGTRWEPDASGDVMRKAKQTVRQIWQDAADLQGTGGEALAKHAAKSESSARLTAMIKLARSEEGVPVDPSDLDRDPWALNTPGATVNLKEGNAFPPRRSDLHSKVANVPYDPDAECPRWLQFLQEIFEGDAELIDFVQRAVGYTLTGSTREQCIFILHGSGANGKGTFVETIAEALGDYAQSARADLLMNRGRSNGPSEAEAALHGARMVMTSETNSGGRFNEATVKRLTGGDTIRARRLYQQEFEFEPTHKLWFATNHKPEIQGTDYAIWRRIRLIPFNRTFGPSERDEELDEKLKEEAPGILAWAVDGCKRWQRAGLQPPEAVQEATDSYRSEMDVLGAFLDECTVQKSNTSAQSTRLYKHYQAWCDDAGEDAKTQREFGTRMTERGFERERKRDGKYYVGIGIRSDRELEKK